MRASQHRKSTAGLGLLRCLAPTAVGLALTAAILPVSFGSLVGSILSGLASPLVTLPTALAVLGAIAVRARHSWR